jgi:hypothetical protein
MLVLKKKQGEKFCFKVILIMLFLNCKLNNIVKMQNPDVDDELRILMTEQRKVLNDINSIGLRVKNEDNTNIERARKIGELCEKSTFTREEFFRSSTSSRKESSLNSLDPEVGARIQHFSICDNRV